MDMFDTAFGTVTDDRNGTVTLRYERVFPRSIGTVWSAISEPERVTDWLGPAELEPRVGGHFAVMVGPRRDIPIKGKVVAWEPPSVLACSWAWPGGAAGLIRFELSAEGPEATRLVFTHSGIAREKMHAVLPGWHLYLERLGQVVGGDKPGYEFSARHAEIRVSYGGRDETEGAVSKA